ncbi:hypothetical protein UlMin_036700 [Ulmus minor]
MRLAYGAVGSLSLPSLTKQELPTSKSPTTKHFIRMPNPNKLALTNYDDDETAVWSPSKNESFTQLGGKLGKRWTEYQGINNWEGLLDPLDHNLRAELLRYGQFVEASYRAFDSDPLSPTYATCRFGKSSLLMQSGFSRTGYKVTKNLHATCGIQLPRWLERLPSWMQVRSSWIGYVAVCQDKNEISRLGRRDVVISLRGTATCLEWLENLRATLTDFPFHVGPNRSGSMVESGFLSLYTSQIGTCPSLQGLIREEIERIIKLYGDEPLSLTITGHSLGAALAIMTAYDITATFSNAPMVTVFSFGGPRVGNKSFRGHMEKSGTKILRIVNSDDPITKVPGFLIDDDDVADDRGVHVVGMPRWIQQRVKDTHWAYADVGQELKLSSKESPYLNKGNFGSCHDLKTYLHLVNGFVSSTCPFRATTEMLKAPFID